MKTSKIGRIMQTLTTLQAGKSCTIDELVKKFGLTRRTIFRDLHDLKNFGIPYHRDPKTGSYSIDSRYFLAPIDFELHEALSLLLMVNKAANMMQLPFKGPAVQASAKIVQNLPVAIRRTCHRDLQNISAIPAAQAPTKQLEKIFKLLQTAIIKKQKVHMRYRSLYEGKIIELCLHPYHLWYHHRAWYMLGWSTMYKSIHTFKLNRIKYLELSEQKFTDDDNFDLFEYLGRAWSMIPEGKIYNIKLKFLPKVAENVTEVLWHSTQKVTRHSDGSATVEFRVDGLGEISWWILGYADQVQVLAPKALRTKIIDMATKMIKLNEQI